MHFSFSSVLIFAEGAPQLGWDEMLRMMGPPFVIIFVLYFLMDSPRRKEQAKRDLMMKNLKKTDRVVTIGGIYGSVVNISSDGKEVTLKVDESTRIKFRRTAIAEVLGDEPADAGTKTS